MRILLYEYITGGGCWECDSRHPPSGSLLAEGAAMIRALAADFAAVSGVRVVVLRDCRLSLRESTSCECIIIGSADEELSVLQREASAADATILIAPESGGALLHRARLVQSAGGRLLSPGPEFIELASDKHRTAEYLRAHGIPAPHGVVLEQGAQLPRDFPYPAVLKPVDGAGSQGVRLVEFADDARSAVGNALRGVPEAGFAPRWPEEVPDRWPADVDHASVSERHGGRSLQECGGRSLQECGGRSLQEYRLEQFHPGLAASVAVLAGPRGPVILPACRQHLAADGTFSYLGGELPLPAELNVRAQRLAKACAAALPPVVGYFGLDLVLGEHPSGLADVVIEVNPRLTTSYVGLRALCQNNLAAAWLAVAKVYTNDAYFRGAKGDNEQPLVELSFSAGSIKFKANGEVAQ